MTNKKSLKRALILNVLSTLLCISMLLGTTFAWFTDTVESGVNTIVAGNLDVGLTHKVGDAFVAVDENTMLFNLTKWEPGAVAYEVLKVSNAGDLALQYALTLKTANATETATGKTLKDALKVAFVEGDLSTTATTRDALVAAAGTFAALDETAQTGVLEATNDSKTYTIVVYWLPSDADNDFNMNNGSTTQLKIEIGASLFATQYTKESDSFNDQYDSTASFPVVTAEGLLSAISGTQNSFEFEDNINETVADSTDARAAHTITSDKTIDFGDYTYTVSSAGSVYNFAGLYIDNGSNVVLDGTTGGINTKDNADSYGVYVVNGDLTINGGSYEGSGTAVQLYYGSVTINGGFFEVKDYDPPYDGYRYVINCIDSTYGSGEATVIVKGGTFVNFDPSNNLAEGTGTNFVADGYHVVSETQTNGDIWYTVVAD